MSALLAVNAGSSSVRLALFEAGAATDGVRCIDQHHGEASTPDARIVADFLAGRTVQAVVHRIVHGGDKLTQACSVTSEVRAELERWAPVAPLHNPIALQWLDACAPLLGHEARTFVDFDTAFFASLPPVAHQVALPRPLCERLAIRRYGAHGLAHEAMWTGFAARSGLAHGGRVITLQLGSGCSAAALASGVPVDTSMGFTPLEGLMMGTRCGDIDAGLLVHLLRVEGWSADRLEAVLTRESGLLGVSQETAKMTDLLRSQRPAAQQAVEQFCYRVRKLVGSYAAALQGVDGIVFGGGIGENLPAVRAAIAEGLGWLGVQLDRQANEKAGKLEAPRKISTSSGPQLWVMPVDEAQVMAQHVITQAGGF